MVIDLHVIVWNATINFVTLTGTALPMITSPTHSIINGTMTVIVAEGSNVTLRCEAAGDGKLEYRWRRVSRSIPGTANGDKNQTLTFTNIRFGNSGKYFCEVKIKGNLQSSKDVQVTVRSELT